MHFKIPTIVLVPLMKQAGRRIVLDATETSPPSEPYNNTSMTPLIIIAATSVGSMLQVGMHGSNITERQNTE